MEDVLNTLLSVFLGASLLSYSDFPIRDTAEYLVQPIPEVRMLSFGDLMLGRDVERLMKLNGENYPFEVIFDEKGLNPEDYDLMTANLEGPVLKAKKRADLEPFFAFDPEVTPRLLKKWGFDLLGLANNHTWDHGAHGWESTLKELHEVGLMTFGNPKNMFDHDIHETELNGVKLAFMGLSFIPFDIDWDHAKKVVQNLDTRNDFVILMPHWGIEYQTQSSVFQRDKAHGMIEAGVDLIIGHHPHVIQESEVFMGKHIYYSLGNFVFDQYFSENVQKGLGLDITLIKGGEVLIEEIPFSIKKGQPYFPVKDQSDSLEI
ncbi:MAG: CapA family protein [Candidatus Gracilibacteria bacterium]|nr:CapA family protein [Candidatus Gracilibacteria bacterium]